ncbi:DUF421 domain-containing protein [Corallococcus macrosporus]|uniref:YetF C-terminal domain-containing protein n=1 Tax=Myxococcus fulvus (strain ATCC BAA-855 / HW-1) TaxID=483219 RepID=F8CN20_MYXFH|nr:YetF domain-containing protein [Corallococcus macrosporus]AEI67826.1 hypothetical protein LILAB_29725 [Corallococcus macrosporus]
MKPIDWHGLWVPDLHPLEVIIRVSLVFLFVQFVLRLVGRKELSRYASFDLALLFLLTVCMRMTIVANDDSLTTGFIALATMGAWDRLFSWLAYRDHRAARLLEGRSLELIRAGRLVHANLRRSRISQKELLSQLRTHGRDDLGAVHAAFFEPSGQVTFLFRDAERAPLR